MSLSHNRLLLLEVYFIFYCCSKQRMSNCFCRNYIFPQRLPRFDWLAESLTGWLAHKLFTDSPPVGLGPLVRFTRLVFPGCLLADRMIDWPAKWLPKRKLTIISKKQREPCCSCDADCNHDWAHKWRQTNAQTNNNLEVVPTKTGSRRERPNITTSGDEEISMATVIRFMSRIIMALIHNSH